MILTDGEIAYVAAQRLGRIATVQSSGEPQLNPVSCYYNPVTETIDIGGHNMGASKKYRNVAHNPLGGGGLRHAATRQGRTRVR